MLGVCDSGVCGEKEDSAEKDIQRFKGLLEKGYHEKAYQMFVDALGDKYLPEKDAELRKHVFGERSPLSYTLNDVVERPLALSKEFLDSMKNWEEHLKFYEKGTKGRVALFRRIRDPEGVFKGLPENWQKAIRNYKISDERLEKGWVWKIDNKNLDSGDKFYFFMVDELAPALGKIGSGLGPYNLR